MIINFLTNKIKKKYKSFIINILKEYENERDIESYVKENAKIESAKLIIEKGINGIVFNSKFELYDFIILNDLVEEDYLEFGVWKGESINYFATNYSRKSVRFFGFDSFEGLPNSWRAGYPKGTFDLGGKKLEDNGNIKYIKGWFKDSLPVFLKTYNGKTPFIHIDCDIYSSTSEVLHLLVDYVDVGLYILFDELIAYPGWRNHEYRALIEFMDQKKLDFEIVGYNKNHEQVLIKLKGI